MSSAPKITTGANERARDETIAQTGEGIPDEPGPLIDPDPDQIERVRRKLMGDDSKPQRAGAEGSDRSAGSPDGSHTTGKAAAGSAGGRLSGSGPSAREGTGSAPARGANPDALPAGSPQAAENICRRCGGSGKADGGPCPDCGGTGIVLTPVGGGG